MSGRRFLPSAAGRWPPLVTVRPSNPLASALAGQTGWDNLEVDRELKLLFGAGDARAFDDQVQTIRESLWRDAYLA